MSGQTKPPRNIVLSPTKNVGTSLILTILLGPLGMLYSTVLGSIIMLIVSIPVAIFTLGFGLLLVWPICVIWGAMAVSSSNKKMLAGAATASAPAEQAVVSVPGERASLRNELSSRTHPAYNPNHVLRCFNARRRTQISARTPFPHPVPDWLPAGNRRCRSESGHISGPLLAL